MRRDISRRPAYHWAPTKRLPACWTPIPILKSSRSRPMTTHRAVRDAARCDAVLIHRLEVPNAYDDDIAGLQDWLDLASFILSDTRLPQWTLIRYR